MAKLKNYGRGPRGIKDSSGIMHVLEIGEEREVNIGDEVERGLRASMRKGDTLHVVPKNRKPGKDEDRQNRAAAVLNEFRAMSYNELLSACKEVMDPNTLPPRPPVGDLLNRLSEIVSGEEPDYPTRFDINSSEPPKEVEPDPDDRNPKALAMRGRDQSVMGATLTVIPPEQAQQEAEGEGEGDEE